MVVFRKGNLLKISKIYLQVGEILGKIWPEVWVVVIFFQKNAVPPRKLTWLAGGLTMSEDILPIENGGFSNVTLVFRGITWHLKMDPSGKVLL